MALRKVNFYRIISLILILIITCTSVSFAVVNDPDFYERVAQQNLEAADHTDVATEKVFYYVTAMYGYCYTKGEGRAVKLLDKIAPVVESDQDNLAANSELVARMTLGSADQLFEKNKYDDAKAMYEATLTYSNNFDADEEDIKHCNEQIVKCEKGTKVDTILIIVAIVVVAIAIIAVTVVSKKSKSPKKKKKL